VKLDFRTSNPVVYGNHHLKSLILGFPQVHNEIDFAKQQPPEPLQQPHVEDLIPLINNIDENRLLSFMGWLANLNNDTSNGQTDYIKKKAKRIIEETFKVVSKIIDKEISFHRVKTITPLDIWIKTADAPNGIPLHLVSQGFKEVIGWIGHLLQRLAEAHPFSDDFTKENGVVILDEIDAFTHPKWQIRLLDVLQDTFVNIQFIVSTHSPLAILNQDMNEVKELYFDENNMVKIEEHKDENAKIDLATTVLNYFNIGTVLKKSWQEKVDKYYELKLAGEDGEDVKELEKELDKTLIGLPIHDYRYFLFLKFLKEKGINPKDTVEKIEMTDEEFKAYQEAYSEYL
jgi:predicted ATP-binding protein involved in virulence